MENDTKLPETVCGVPLEKVKAEDIIKSGLCIAARKRAENDPLYFKKVHLWLSEVVGIDAKTPVNIFNVLEYAEREWDSISLYYFRKEQLNALTAKKAKKVSKKRSKKNV
jgi:hypothetical protein